MDESTPELDRAIVGLKKFLAAPITPREMYVTHRYDQFAAALRDMNADEREAVAQSLASGGEMTVAEARDWIARLVSGE